VAPGIETAAAGPRWIDRRPAYISGSDGSCPGGEEELSRIPWRHTMRGRSDARLPWFGPG